MRSLSALVVLMACTLCPSRDQRLRAQDCVDPPGKVCSCQTASEILDPEAALMDGAMLRSLLAVVDYRGHQQRKKLRSTELQVTNFRISVSRKPTPKRKNVYVVLFAAKTAPGEPEQIGSTSLGDSYTYYVDKRTFGVVAFELQE